MTREMMQPRGLTFDFLSPTGEAALAPMDGISWRVFRNPVSVFIGGATAVLLELAEARVRAGVWDFTTFRRDPVNRLKRTGLAAMATVYGARSKSEALIANVVRAHERVQGVTPEGGAYRANEPELLDWVQATASYGFAGAYHRYVRRLSAAEMDAAYAEGAEASLLYGSVGAPKSAAEMVALFVAMRPKLTPSPIIHEFLAIMGSAEILPAPMRPLQHVLLRASVDLAPAWLRELAGLQRHGLRPGEELLVKSAARAAERVVLDSHPATLACRRMGLPRDYLLR